MELSGVQRPAVLAATYLSDDEYKAIGEIVVASGMLEAALREIVHALANVHPDDGAALTSHQSYASLSDMALALCHDGLRPSKLRRKEQDLAALIKRARLAYDKRSQVVHGPFLSFPREPNIPLRLTYKAMARGKLSRTGMAYAAEFFSRLRDEIADCVHALRLDLERRKSGA